MSPEAAKVSIDVLLDAMRAVWARHYAHRVQLALEVEPTAKDDAEGIRRVIEAQLDAAHPLTRILRAALIDLVQQCEAFDLLAGKESCVMHARAVEETAAIVEFIVKDEARYEEFRWRWDSAQAVHAIRNRHFGLKLPLDPKMTEWLAINADQLQRYVKIKGPPEADEKSWAKFSNWLYRISIRDMFEGIGKVDSYLFKSYEYANHSTHFSPIGDLYSGFELSGGRSYTDMFREFIELSAHSFLKIVLPIVTDVQPVREHHAASILRMLFLMGRKSPERLVALSVRSNQLRNAIGVILMDGTNRNRVETALLGAELPPATGEP